MPPNSWLRSLHDHLLIERCVISNQVVLSDEELIPVY